MRCGAVRNAVRCMVCRVAYRPPLSWWCWLWWWLALRLAEAVAHLGLLALCLLWHGQCPGLLGVLWQPSYGGEPVEGLRAGRALVHVSRGGYDGLFAESVVLLTEHDASGSVGYILNKPLYRKRPPHRIAAVGLILDTMVGVDSGSHAVMLTGSSAAAVQILPGVHLQPVQEDVAVELVLGANATHAPRLKLLLGYAGWGPRQLDG
eukprot:EG_transcript_29731